ncbi:MAG: CDP-diacylglycerol--glycerol-3-phosphate 3-phosphatidyltransferase [Alphaproteobacteria bacterium]|nr:CDP-diacylglycerol--glycerol-3-phosphate 3-phosphatidyltransferase [Rhodobiaceae bacterium]PDH50957.1 MAG: CDP-diacylglycerol--glycerol-3-phosphate 3-phosphatidyltransferase [alpha proteobacterium MED-G09]|tara:strand:+ start:84 stop:662 length:579 start_codon:yes stop_codon:yes gene_type:complete
MPNLLTVLRIIFASLIALILIFFDSKIAYFISFILFSLAGITDYFDGWLARKKGQISDLGRMLDPIADKILVISTFIILMSNNVIEGFNAIAAFIIIYREIFISGLREFLGNKSLVVKVTKLAKWKTAIQFITILVFLGSQVINNFYMYTDIINIFIEFTCTLLIWITSLISLYTGINYLRTSYGHLSTRKK